MTLPKTLPAEPPADSVVLDVAGDAWQRHYNGWHCAIDDIDYAYFTWERLNAYFHPITIIRAGAAGRECCGGGPADNCPCMHSKGDDL